MFVEDTELTTAEKHNVSNIPEAYLNTNRNQLKEYLDYNRLSLNIPKCEFMPTGTHQSFTNMPKRNVLITNELCDMSHLFNI